MKGSIEMRMHQIFNSEGGYRLVKGLWGDDPVIKQSPWFETLNAARIERERCRLKAAMEKEEDDGLYGDFDGISERMKKIDRKYKQLIKNAAPVAAEDDPE